MRRAKLHSGIQVLVVDDNYEHAAGIRGIASLDGGFDVVGTANNSDTCIWNSLQHIWIYTDEDRLLSIYVPYSTCVCYGDLFCGCLCGIQKGQEGGCKCLNYRVKEFCYYREKAHGGFYG